MMTKVQSAACLGIKAYPVEIEVDVASGLPQFIVVGLPDASINFGSCIIRILFRRVLV